MSSSPSTFQTNTCEDVYGDSSEVSVYRWSIGASMQGLEDKASQRELRKKLTKSLESAIACLSYLSQKENTMGQFYVPVMIAKKSETAPLKSTEINLWASHLSWIAKCSLTRYLLLETHGSLNYITPPSVEKAKTKHDHLVNIFIDILKKEPEITLMEKTPKLCLLVKINQQNRFRICGIPDSIGLIYRKNLASQFMLVIEISTSPTVKHIIRGELLFYIIASYMHYGIPVVGLLLNREYIHLVIPHLNSAKQLINLLRERDLEKELENAKNIATKTPWKCNLCDLKHICPVGAEI